MKARAGALRIIAPTILLTTSCLLSGSAVSAAPTQTQTQTGAWSPTGSMSTPRYLFRATVLLNGKVLVTGGRNASGQAFTSAELYDPESGTWSTVASMHTPRYSHSATLLPSGKVLVAGGSDGTEALASSETYDPQRDTWKTSADMRAARVAHAAEPVEVDGSAMVLVTGGADPCQGCDSLASAEMYDPRTDAWTAAGNMQRDRYWDTPAAVVTTDDRVFVVGGVRCCPRGYWFRHEAELYDPTADRWSRTSPRHTRSQGRAALMSNGQVLVAGGTTGLQFNAQNLATSELYLDRSRPVG